MNWFWSTTVHHIITFIHVLAGIFWLGWIVFIFKFLKPLSEEVLPENALPLQSRIQQRVRSIVFWLIPLILLTGLYNMGYWGLLQGNRLFETAMGQRMLIKLGAALIIFAVYYLAPVIMKYVQSKSKALVQSSQTGSFYTFLQKIPGLLHLLAFLAGLTAAYLGVTIGG